MSIEMIPFQIDAQRVVELLAKKIYQSPLALLRENTQNAFDAVRLRLHLEHDFQPRIDVTIHSNVIVVADNGIGMTAEDLRNHYWKAGSSSKNNEQARAAGVVGTFGIGAMANFGIAELLIVETESALTCERSLSKAEKSKLSLRNDCIELSNVPGTGHPGTKVSAHLSPGAVVDAEQAKIYISEFLSLIDVPVYVNGQLVSQKPIEDAVPIVPDAWKCSNEAERIGTRLVASMQLVVSNNADIWIKITNIIWDGQSISGRIVVRSGVSVLKTFRSGFGLAAATVSSFYQFGGVADLAVLEPTAGREAVTVEGVQLLQSIITEVDSFVSMKLSELDYSDSSAMFMQWVNAHGRFELCGRLNINISPGDRLRLYEVKEMSKKRTLPLYEGSDNAFITMHATEESPLLILARTNPRRQCEVNFLSKFCNVEKMNDSPIARNIKLPEELTLVERALCYRIETIVDSDYFLKSEVKFAEISHNLPVLVENGTEGLVIYLNPKGQTVLLLSGLYENEYSAYGSMAKDFVRTLIFPRIADYVPSSTRQGAEAFLKVIRKPRELFEYCDGDLGNLPKIWSDYNDGIISLETAVEQSRQAALTNVQVVDSTTTQNVNHVVPDVIQNEQALQQPNVNEQEITFDPSPAITRLEVESNAKMLVIEENEPLLRGYRCFLAITDRAREEMGEFFLQPHRTSIVWGGQRTLFIFLHHSGQFGLYYDLQTREPINASAGGGPFATSTIVIKNKIYIPIPDAIRESFLPFAGEKKRFEVRVDVLKTDGPAGDAI